MSQPRGLVIITGGAGAGIGQAISLAVARSGWAVAIGDKDKLAADKVAADMRDAGHSAVGVHLEVADESSVERLFHEVLHNQPPLRGLVNNAGVGLVKPLGEVTVAEWDRVHGVDLRGAFLCTRSAIPLLIRNGGGSIVNIGSIQASGPHIGYATYAAAKAGLIGLTRGTAADYGRVGIRCSIIHPGLVDGPQNRELFAQWGDTEQWIDDYVRTRQMIPSLISAAEIGATAAFLLSDSARSITAAEITVDAGSSSMAFDNIGDTREAQP